MSGFSAEWLALRERADAAARSKAVTSTLVDALRGRSPLRIVDLGCGTGSNMRYLAPLLRDEQEWRLVDHDPALLAVARASAGRMLQTRVADLRELDETLLTDRDLVTASALLDLVSEKWLARLVAQCRRAGASVLAVLSYDGRIDCSPADVDDAWVRDLVNKHQRTDKGLGPALGPEAGRRAEGLLAAAGYEVHREKSDWVLGPDQSALQRELLAGWAEAAAAVAPEHAPRLHAWLQRRRAHVDAGVSHVVVGHDDVAGVLR